MLEMFRLYPPIAAFDEVTCYIARTIQPQLPQLSVPAACRLPPLYQFYAFEAVAGFYKLPPLHELTQLLKGVGMPAAQAETFSRRHFYFQASHYCSADRVIHSPVPCDTISAGIEQ